MTAKCLVWLVAAMLWGAQFAGPGGSFELAPRESGHYQVAIRRGTQWRALEPVNLSLGETEVVSRQRLEQKIPRQARQLHHRAIERQKAGDLDGAVGIFEQAVGLAPGYLEAINDLAVLHLRRREELKAEQWARRAVAIDDRAWQPRVNLALALLSRKAYAKARAELEKAEALGSRSPLAPFHLGRLHVLQGRIAEAEACFTRAIERDPKLWRARLFRGFARVQLGRWDQARQDLEICLREAPDGEDTGRAKSILEDMDKAGRPKVGVLLEFDQKPSGAQRPGGDDSDAGAVRVVRDA